MRCNLVNPQILTDQHLIAERRELRMIPPLLKQQCRIVGLTSNLKTYLSKKIPQQFTLGSGHMLFWLNKFKFLESRFISLTSEMKFRGFNPDETLELETSLAKTLDLYLSWIPTQRDIEISKDRIIQRILQKPTWYRFHSRPISLAWLEQHYFPEHTVTLL